MPTNAELNSEVEELKRQIATLTAAVTNAAPSAPVAPPGISPEALAAAIAAALPLVQPLVQPPIQPQMPIENIIAATVAAVNANRPSVTAMPMDFKVTYDGKNDRFAALDWLTAWKSHNTVFPRGDQAAIETARRTLTDAAGTWFARIYSTVQTADQFEDLFKQCFVPDVDAIQLGLRMNSRVQGANEDVMTYVHDKMRLLAPLNLDIDTQKKYVYRGCRWHSLISHLKNTVVANENELIQECRTYVEDTQHLSKPTTSTSFTPKSSQPITRKPTAVATPKTDTASASSVTRTEPKVDSTHNVVTCYNCYGQGHMSRECPQPRRVPKCTNCQEMGHVKSKCPKSDNTVESGSTLVATEYEVPVTAQSAPIETTVVKYNRDAVVGSAVVSAQIDPGSIDCLIRATDAFSTGLTFSPSDKRFIGLGPGTTSVGMSNVPITIDDITLEVPLYVVPDACLPVPLLVGRTWTENPTILFVRVRDTFKFLRHDEFAARQLAEIVVENEPPVVRTTEPVIVSSEPSFVGCIVESKPSDGVYMFVADNAVGTLVKHTEKLSLPIYTNGKPFALPPNTAVGYILQVDEELRNSLSSSHSSELWKPFTLGEVPMGPNLTTDQQLQILETINNRRRAFATSIKELGCTDLIEMDIDEIPGSTPPAQKPYRSSIGNSRILEEIIQEWREAGIVEPSTSPYAAPALLVDKKDGKKRPVFDYRRLNAQTIPLPFPMPNIDDQLSELSEAVWYVTLDLFSGYLQLRMSEKAKHKTAFVTQYGHMQFNRMPFGLKNAPPVFQCLVNSLFRKFWRYVFIYLDDIIIIARSFAELILRLIEVLDVLRSANLTCRLEKCMFATKTIEFLGFIIDHGNLLPGYRKTAAISNFPRPRDAREIRRFLGLTGFFRRFIVKYATIASPLNELTKKDAVFNWGPAQESSFEELKRKLVSSPVLKLFDRTKPIEVHTDASSLGVAGMLMQRHDEELHLVYAVSKRCSPSESLYHSSRLELLAIVWTLMRLRSFLIGQHFTVVTDCQCITYLHKAKATNGQLARWAILISEYDVQFKHRPGTSMAHVDAISRAPCPGDTSCGIEQEITDSSPALVLIVNQVDEIRTFQAEDEEIRKIIKFVGIQGNRDPDFVVTNGLLYRKQSTGNVFVLPKTMRKAICIKYHDQSGHYSLEKVVAAIATKYWFAGMRQYIKTHIRRCFPCLIAKGQSGKKAGLLRPIPPATVPFVTVHVDHLGPLVTSIQGYQHVFVVVDSCTRYVELYASDSTGSEEVVQNFEKFVLRFGYPRQIVSDRGTAFTGTDFTTWCDSHGVGHTLVSTRHPRANGLVERVNRVIVPQIIMYSKREDNADWPDHLPLIQRNINSSINRSLDKSPFELLYGFRPNFVDSELIDIQPEPSRRDPNELRAEAHANIVAAQNDNKRSFDRRHCPGDNLEIGQIVFVHDAPGKKLDARFRGPLVVVKQVAPDTYRCQTLNTQGVVLDTNFHISAIRVLPPKNVSRREDATEPQNGRM